MPQTEDVGSQVVSMKVVSVRALSDRFPEEEENNCESSDPWKLGEIVGEYVIMANKDFKNP